MVYIQVIIIFLQLLWNYHNIGTEQYTIPLL